ncbi:MAG: M14 family metallocarboxypeptidase [Parahaliea sp.]
MNSTFYPVGTPGQPWTQEDRNLWRSRQVRQRSYIDDVLAPLAPPINGLKKQVYSELNYIEQGRMEQGRIASNCAELNYPLIAFCSTDIQSDKPCALITGGVHGYETSGVKGAIRFLQTMASHYAQHINLLVAPCISPWAYETINRWNPMAIDPNRSFYRDSPAPESAALMQLLSLVDMDFNLHIDLHETTDTDASEFRPALAARDGQNIDLWESIPDGFYLVGDTEKPADDFQQAIIQAVKTVTHIAPADEQGQVIGETLTQYGVINYPNRKLGLCAGITDAAYVTTTEVYPDSPRVDEQNCILAQVTAIQAALDYLLCQQQIPTVVRFET